jgi:hypothetical protein
LPAGGHAPRPRRAGDRSQVGECPEDVGDRHARRR